MATVATVGSSAQAATSMSDDVLDPPAGNIAQASVDATEVAHFQSGVILERDRSAPWRAGVVVSLLLHGGVAAAVMFGLARLRPPTQFTDAVMMVEVAPTPSAPSITPRYTPPGPQQVRAVAKPIPVHQPKIPPPPQIAVPVQPEVVLQAKAQPQPDRPVLKKDADQTTSPQAVTAPPGPDTAAPAAGASSVVSNAPQTWENSLLAKLQHNKRYPDAAQSHGLQDVVYLRIAIDRSGRLVDANVVRSRGYAMLDSEALSLARRSSPFSPPPADEEGDPVVVVVPVEFFITHRRGG